ncbi:unnamed protein product [Heterobilharzia americana]|nr:unnamed protein product [Heterobilharzia americana]
MSKPGVEKKNKPSRINLKSVWRSTALSTKNKIRIFNTNVKSALLYGSETWHVTKSISNKLQTFTNSLRLRSLDTDTEDQMDCQKKISNKELWPGKETTTNPSCNKYAEESGNGLDWAYTEKADWGHHAPGQVLDWNPNGKRRVGRPIQG